MKKIIRTIVQCLLPIFLTMNSANSQNRFTVKPTNQCIKYIESFGLTIHDFQDSLSSGSPYTLVFKLPNNEIVMIPSDLNEKYVGFIYEDTPAFIEMKENDFFPVGQKNLTFWELERDYLNKFPASVPHYTEFLKKELKVVDLSFEKQELEKIYSLVAAYRKGKNPAYSKDKITLAFSLIVMNDLVQKGIGKWQITTRYKTYNSYKYPLVIAYEEKKDVISLAYSTFENKKGDFLRFYSYITTSF